MTDKASMPATARYRMAVAVFRTAYGILAAEDRRLGRQGFGEPIHAVALRHAIANPTESGALSDDVEKAMKGT
jgi:hypothetical protein